MKRPTKVVITDINSEDRLVQKAFADHLHDVIGWESIYAFNDETFGLNGMLGRASEREVILIRDLRTALKRLNPALPGSAREQPVAPHKKGLKLWPNGGRIPPQ